jgi:hypothetical protein
MVQSANLSWCQAPQDFCYCQTVAGLLMWYAFSDERKGLSFTTAAGPRQRSHSRVEVPRDSRPYSAVSDSRLLPPKGPGPSIYIPQEQGGPVIPTGTAFPFRRLLRLAGLRWRYSTAPPHGLDSLESQSQIESSVRVTLRLVVYRQSICLGDKPLETHDQ